MVVLEVFLACFDDGLSVRLWSLLMVFSRARFDVVLVVFRLFRLGCRVCFGAWLLAGV